MTGMNSASHKYFVSLLRMVSALCDSYSKVIVLIHDMFTIQARCTPDVIALVGHETAYTYGELDRLTSGIAGRLRSAGVRPESVVGCWSRDTVSTVVQVLSVLKSGGAYLLLDPQLPTDRLRYMVDDTDPVCILGVECPPDTVAGRRTLLMMGDLLDLAGGDPATDYACPATEVGPVNLAYVAYTSGSTGRPKGVLIPHSAVTNHAESFRARFDLRPGDRLPLMAPVAFDMATEEILPPLVSGCTLLDAPRRSPSMREFTDDVLTSGYTILNIPAPLWHQWTTYLRDTDSAVPPTLRLVIVGSDKIYTSKLEEWKALRGAESVWWVAAYGVTEATVTSLLYLTAAQDDLREEPLVPIGTPLDNVAAIVVRDDGAVAAPGETGELYIGGAGLARGYRNLPVKTADRFVHDLFASPSRHYRTGDLVRRRPDGSIVWLGRRDSQIKINGLRIEPAEIEAMIHEHPSASEAVVVFKPPTVAGEAGALMAYVEVKEHHEIDADEVLSFLAARLHPLMVPDEIIVLERIPLNANGKIDRKALEIMTFEQVS
ncbi:amino acid adenylation domain-containing protein [Mycolicibacterium sp. S2-37]|uniref:amino acid adenylation domain-containing protein n=1 Tax=Mycolicibacterium sp. S2-37 TaxID=2810297 RepID=UPI001A9511EF|nr:amino acid adenylation domain-containing protein [Mycolicibacterium sp. S2-37]MBO0678124.1 amino acid adenylation domain-containing protein [Mycolicibacterium sp. S2-37]